jgi:hypothetical protein
MAAPAAESKPAIRISRFSSCASAIMNTVAGRKVITAATPSRDSQEDRHWLSARQARSGRRDRSSDEQSPAVISASAMMAAVAPKRLLAGSRPSGFSTPSQNSSP